MRSAVVASFTMYAWMLLGPVACAGVDGLTGGQDENAAPPSAPAPREGRSDAAPAGGPDADRDVADAGARCNPGAPFGDPQRVSELSTSEREESARLMPDEVTIYFVRWNTGDYGYRIYTSARPSVGAPFSEPIQLVETNVDLRNGYPSPSDDGLSLYFWVQYLEGSVIDTTYVITRATVRDAWGPPHQVGHFGSRPFVLGTQLALYAVDSPGIVRIALPSGAPVPVLDGFSFSDPVPSRDELTLFVSANVPPSPASSLSMARRSMTAAPFADAGPVRDFDAGSDDVPSWLSPDGCLLYMTRAGDIYTAQRAR